MNCKVIAAGVVALLTSAVMTAAAQDTVRPPAPKTKDSSAARADLKQPRVVLVYDAATKEMIPGAVVLDLITKNSMTTSIDGAVGLFVGSFVKADGAMLRITKSGYEPAVIDGVVDPLQSATIQVGLTRLAAGLPAMVTTAPYRLDTDPGVREGIDIRCGSNLVTCFKEDFLAERASYELFDFLKSADGVHGDCVSSSIRRRSTGNRSDRDNGAPRCAITMKPTTGTGTCTPTYFVDGYQGWTQAQVEQFFSAKDIEAIEIYRSEQPRPMRFEGDPLCGAVVIWKRQPGKP